MSYRLGVDIGGTFTDFVAYDEDGKALKAWKNLSTPQNPMEGIMTGLRAFGATDAVSGIRLGTTVATNALLEGKGATVAYVTTRGFKDIPFIGRGNRRHHYDLAWVKPKPFVQRRHAFEVDERVGPSGETLQPLDETQVRTLAQDIKAGGKVNAIAVVLLHSYLTPNHEQRIKAIFAEEIPDIPVSISYEVLPKWKEHFRSSTTICDAFIKPVVETTARRHASRTRRARHKRQGRRHALQWRRNDSRQGRGSPDPDRRIRADGRRDRRQTHRRGFGPPQSRDPRHGRYVDGRVHSGQRQGEVHHRFRDRVGAANSNPDDRHPHHRSRRRLDRSNRRGRHVGGWSRERRRQSGTGVLRARRRAADSHRRQCGAWPHLRPELPRRDDEPRRRGRPQGGRNHRGRVGHVGGTGRARHREDRQQQHGGRASHRADRTGPRPARFRARGVRRRRPAPSSATS